MPSDKLPLDQVIHGDCLQVMKELPSESVDLIFADPPYNLQLHQELWRPNMTRVDAVDDEWDQFGSFSEYDTFTRAWLVACRRILKPSGTIWVIGTYHNIFRVGAAMQDLGFWLLNDVIWVKTNPMPNFRGVRFTNATETLIWAQKERGARYTFNHHNMKALNDDLQMRSDWYLPLCTGKQRIRIDGIKAHATQKPEALLYRVIMSSSNVGDIVLDPFFGMGTTGAMAKKLGRRWIGIELDESYVRLARQRIDVVETCGEEAVLMPPESKSSRLRISVGMLLEQDLLSPGQILYFGKQGTISGTLLANGHIRCHELVGSIHQVGRALLKAPCNGWDLWYYLDDITGERVVIDRLRQVVREQREERGFL
jgi:site-specific DNA-methyltransferase (adenine-specific)